MWPATTTLAGWPPLAGNNDAGHLWSVQLTLDDRRPACSAVLSSPDLPCMHGGGVIILLVDGLCTCMHGTLQSKLKLHMLTVDDLACARCTCTESRLDPGKEQMKRKSENYSVFRQFQFPQRPTRRCFRCPTLIAHATPVYTRDNWRIVKRMNQEWCMHGSYHHSSGQARNQNTCMIAFGGQ